MEALVPAGVFGAVRKRPQHRVGRQLRRIVVAANRPDDGGDGRRTSPTADELLRASNWVDLLAKGAKQASSLAVVVGNALSESISESTKRKAKSSSGAGQQSKSTGSSVNRAATTTVRKTVETTQTFTVSGASGGSTMSSRSAPKQLESGQLLVRVSFPSLLSTSARAGFRFWYLMSQTDSITCHLYHVCVYFSIVPRLLRLPSSRPATPARQEA